MNVLRTAWRNCAGLRRLVVFLECWTLWILLTVLLAVQVYLVTSPEIAVPRPLLRYAEKRLAASGLQIGFAHSSFDLAGRIRLDDVRVATLSLEDPVLTARSLYAELDPWSLFYGRLDLRRVSATGVDLLLPAPLSPSGRAEPVLNDLDFSLALTGRRDLELTHFTGHFGNLVLQAEGGFRLPAPRRPGTPPRYNGEELIRAYLVAARQAAQAAAVLAPLADPQLELHFTPSEDHLAIVSATVRASAVQVSLPAPAHPGPLHTGPVRLSTRFLLADAPLRHLRLEGTVDGVTRPGEGRVDDLRFALVGELDQKPFAWRLQQVDLSVSAVAWRDYATGPVALSLDPSAWPQITFAATLAPAGVPWSLAGTLDPRAGSGRAEAAGTIDRRILALASELAHRDFTTLLVPAGPAPASAAVTLAPGWKPLRAEGRLHSGPVRVGGVPLDEAGATFTYADGRVVCDNLVLAIGDSLARGRYEMDTVTRDFRFLLTGRLRPAGIAPWFHGWWTNFWKDFAFAAAPPDADVDVRGRWGDVRLTQVFVAATAPATTLRGVPFDQVRTRLLVRPNWFDIMEFDVTQGPRRIQGSFSRLLDLARDDWQAMEFALRSDLDLDQAASLLGATGRKFVEPYRFAQPPRLTLGGRLEGPASPQGRHETVEIGVESTGLLDYHDFPLTDLVFQARLRDTDLSFSQLSFGFAGGHIDGTARVWTAPTGRRLAFDGKLKGAVFGEVVRLITAYDPASAKPGDPARAPKPDDEALRKRSQRLAAGVLNLALTAEGPYDDLRGLAGTGAAEITGAELGQLNLLGALSEALRGTLLNFSSFTFDTVRARFALGDRRLDFEEFKVSGPRALIDAHGDYALEDGRLDFKAVIRPFEESKSLVGSAVSFVLSPLSRALEVKLQGTLAKPSWVFVYGPTSLLRTLIGGDSDKSEKSPAPAVEPGE